MNLTARTFSAKAVRRVQAQLENQGDDVAKTYSAITTALCDSESDIAATAVGLAIADTVRHECLDEFLDELLAAVRLGIEAERQLQSYP